MSAHAPATAGAAIDVPKKASYVDTGTDDWMPAPLQAPTGGHVNERAPRSQQVERGR